MTSTAYAPHSQFTFTPAEIPGVWGVLKTGAGCWYAVNTETSELGGVSFKTKKAAMASANGKNER
jgi:hypothetical protein